MSNFLKSVTDTINVINVANISVLLNKYSNYIIALLILTIIYQLYLATFVRENFGGASGSTSSSDKTGDNKKDKGGNDTAVSGTSCTQFSSCSDCTNAQIDRTDKGCFWNPTCKKCGSFKDEGYFSTCDAKKDPNIKCGSDGDSRPIPQTDDIGGGGDNNAPSPSPAPYDDTILNSGSGIPLPYNDFGGGAAISENGCPVCPKLTLLKGPTYTTA